MNIAKLALSRHREPQHLLRNYAAGSTDIRVQMSININVICDNLPFDWTGVCNNLCDRIQNNVVMKIDDTKRQQRKNISKLKLKVILTISITICKRHKC